MKKSVICQLCNFSPKTPGTFVDAMISLARYCHDKMQIGTFCVFPETAKDRKWLQIFDEERIGYGLVPRKRNVGWKIRQLLANYDPLIFHTHFSLYDLCPVFLKLGFYRTAKILWHYHNPTPSTFSQRTKDAIKFQIIARPFGASSIAVGDGVYRSLIDAGVPSQKLFLVHNGVNTDRFFSNKDARNVIRESLGIRDFDETTIFLLLGWDPIRKGVDVFIKAALEAVRIGAQSSLFLIVGGNDTRQFASKLPELSLLGQFLKIIDPVDDFSSLLNAIDVLVCSSRSEGLSYAVAEALSAGKLLMCSDIPGVREAYAQVSGVSLFPTEDYEMLAQLMKKALHLPSAERESLGRINAQYVHDHYSLELWTNKIGDIYSRILNE